MTAIVSVVCNEPEGSIVRRVYPMMLTPENLKLFWEKAKQFKTIFSQEVNSDFKKFVETFVSQEDGALRAHGLFWVIDDFVGVYYMTHINEIEALAHYTFFDRRHKGREELTRELLRYVFRHYGFWRLNVELPLYSSKHTLGFVKALGFKKEGRKRQAVEWQNTKWDVATFGILREELLKTEEQNYEQRA